MIILGGGRNDRCLFFAGAAGAGAGVTLPSSVVGGAWCWCRVDVATDAVVPAVVVVGTGNVSFSVGVDVVDAAVAGDVAAANLGVSVVVTVAVAFVVAAFASVAVVIFWTVCVIVV